ncbi:MAG: V/A-type H+/Na+-transporting ATPase subunit K [Eubacteriales bacterium SKADARSKE-1]|nr:V/A-type H+/Na+-transporting ATPase subunit K [Eubacteriales bacterium SKADARSKE-1]
MSSLFIVAIFVGLIILSIVLSNRAFKRGAKAKKVVVAQILSFLFTVTVCSVGAIAINASADTNKSANVPVETTASETTSQASNDKGMGYIAMAISMGLGCLGAGFAVASAAPAAIGATSEDPKAFGKSLVFVALAEGVTVFGLLISIFIYGSLT